MAAAAFNYSVDCLGIFHPEKGIGFYPVEALFKGRMVAGRLELSDERNFQKLVVSSRPLVPDVIVIGSSRSMLLRAPYLSVEGPFFNHSVAAAAMEDYMGIVGLYLPKGRLPGTVIISVDPWVFNQKNGLSRWRDLEESFSEMIKEMGGSYGDFGLGRERSPHIGQLISFEYTWRNIESLFRKKERRFFVTESDDIDNFVRAPDGSLYLPHAARFRPDRETEKLVAAWPENRQDYLRDFNVLSKSALFEDFVRYMKRRRIQVILLMIPFHPKVYEKMKVQYPMVVKTEDYVRQFGLRENIEVVGSFDPAPYGLTTKDFFDGTHPHDWVLRDIFTTRSEPRRLSALREPVLSVKQR